MLCPEPGCSSTFEINPDYRMHWNLKHKKKKGQRVPRGVPIDTIDTNESDEKPKEHPLKAVKADNVFMDFKYVPPPNSPSSSSESSESESVASYKRKMNNNVHSSDSITRVKRLKCMQQMCHTLQETLALIKNMDCDDQTKDMLRQMTMQEIEPKSTAKKLPPIIISHLVQEYLGYIPAKAAGKAVSTLYVAIGTESRKEHLRLYGKPPGKRLYSFGNETKETNDYKSSDKGWIMDIVRVQCEKMKLYPRPKVSMARGEEIHQF